MEQTSDDINKTAKKLIADCYEVGATACVLVGFNDSKNNGAVIRAATGSFEQLMMLLAIELAQICKETDSTISNAIKILKLCAKECRKHMDEQDDMEGK